MAEPSQLPIPIKLTNPTALDYYAGPWPSLAAARAAVPVPVRYDGLTVKIIGQGEYWWLEADLSDAGLITKSTGSGSAKLYDRPGQNTDGAMSQQAATNADLAILQQIPYPPYFSGMSIKATYTRTYSLALYQYTNDATTTTTPDKDSNAKPVGYWLTPDQRSALANVSAANPALGQTQGDARYILQGQAGPAFTEQDTNTANLTLADNRLSVDVNLADTVDIDLFSDSEGVKAQFTPARKAALANISPADPAVPNSALLSYFPAITGRALLAIDAENNELVLSSEQLRTYNRVSLRRSSASKTLTLPFLLPAQSTIVAFIIDSDSSGGLQDGGSGTPVLVRQLIKEGSAPQYKNLATIRFGDVIWLTTVPVTGVSIFGEQDRAEFYVISRPSITASVATPDALSIFDVPAAKRQAVVAANSPALTETDTAYYGKEFYDEVNVAGEIIWYRCAISAQADGTTKWKWFRTELVG